MEERDERVRELSGLRVQSDLLPALIGSLTEPVEVAAGLGRAEREERVVRTGRTVVLARVLY